MYYENFEKLCKENNVKPATVSKSTGVPTSTLTSWKQGKYTPKQKTLQPIADYFNVSVDYLMTGKEISHSDEMVLDEIELIETYRQLTDEQKEDTLNIMKMYLNKLKKEV